MQIFFQPLAFTEYFDGEFFFSFFNFYRSNDQCSALRFDSTDTSDAAAFVAASPRVEWPEKRSISTPAAFSSFLIQADLAELWTWGCCPTDPISKRSLLSLVRYFFETSQYRFRHSTGTSCSSVSFLRKMD